MQTRELQSLLDDLANRIVFQKTISGNQIRLWFDGPANSAPISLMIEPAWRVEKGGLIVATSADLPWDIEDGECDAAYRTRCQAAWNLSDCVIGKRVVQAKVSQNHDLRLVLENEIVIDSFTIWRDSENWTLRLYEDGREILISWNTIEEQKTD